MDRCKGKVSSFHFYFSPWNRWLKDWKMRLTCSSWASALVSCRLPRPSQPAVGGWRVLPWRHLAVATWLVWSGMPAHHQGELYSPLSGTMKGRWRIKLLNSGNRTVTQSLTGGGGGGVLLSMWLTMHPVSYHLFSTLPHALCGTIVRSPIRICWQQQYYPWARHFILIA